jgi:hypothetical protein
MIVVSASGKIMEQGNHQELTGHNGLYRRLFLVNYAYPYSKRKSNRYYTFLSC